MIVPLELMKQDMIEMNFVIWDRFVINNKLKTVEVFGWIEREKDNYKDFVILRYQSVNRIEKWNTFYQTSSLKYSKDIFKILECSGKHLDCKRVEDYLTIKNMVRLKKEQI